MKNANHVLVGSVEAIKAKRFLVLNIVLRGRPCSALVFYFEEQAHSYVNDCMHMHRQLNCEQDAIFDETGRFLRCSMHGFVFDPTTGECQSPVCYGERLQPLKLKEWDGMLYFAEKHLRLQTEE